MPELYPEDQRRVDEFVSSSVNTVERKPFKPLVLLAFIIGVLGGLTLVSYLVAVSHGVI